MQMRPQMPYASLQAVAVEIGWNYDRAELIADGIVHLLGVCLGLIGATALVVLTIDYTTTIDVAAVCLYVVGLLCMLMISATYNLWPISHTKWLLRRLDHSAIYVLIATTYTPLIMELTHGVAILIGIWCIAGFGITMKFAWPGRFDRLSIGLCFAMGWGGLVLYDRLVAALPRLSLSLVVAGGAIYSLGVIFYVWRGLRFQNAIWHCFVLVGAVCHYVAILDLVMA